MSKLSTAPNVASKAARATYNAATTRSSKRTTTQTHPPLLNYTYHPNPTIYNLPLFNPTRIMLAEPDHPLHIRTVRRFNALDPNLLHWNVHVPLELSKKAVVRGWVNRRIREAFIAALKEKGWGRKGEVLEGDGRGLKGSLTVQVNSKATGKAIWTVKGTEVKRECEILLERVLVAARKRGGFNEGSDLGRKTTAGVANWRKDFGASSREMG